MLSMPTAQVYILVIKIKFLSTTDKIHLKSNVTDGSLANGLRQPIIYNLKLDKLPGYKVFLQTDTIDYKKENQPVAKTITFYLEDDDNREFQFNANIDFYFTISENLI